MKIIWVQVWNWEGEESSEKVKARVWWKDKGSQRAHQQHAD